MNLSNVVLLLSFRALIAKDLTIQQNTDINKNFSEETLESEETYSFNSFLIFLLSIGK